VLGGLGDGVKQIAVALLHDVLQGIGDDLFGHDAALTALAGCAQLFAYIAQARGAAKYSVFDLVIGNAFAYTNVHFSGSLASKYGVI